VSAALAAEWTKLRTVPSTAWLLAAAVALTVALGAALSGMADPARCPSPAACPQDPTRLALTGVWLGQAAVVVLAALVMTGEYDSGTMATTLAATPRRGVVLAAKAVVVAAAGLAAGVLAVAGSLAAGRVILWGNGFTPANGYRPLSPADQPTLRAAAGTVLYLGLVALLGLGLGAVVRDTAGTLVAVLALLYAVPVVAAFVSDPQWQARLQRVAPMPAGLAVQATTGLDRLPIGPWAGLGVLAAWAGAAMALGAVRFAVRDA
jgi:ABC-type transport system involved in multi-copper enzyme maturation permease subunit